MILDGMTLDDDGQQLADDYASEDQDELAYYAAWVTTENERLRGEVKRLREVLIWIRETHFSVDDESETRRVLDTALVETGDGND
jgi:hypothetical protein